MKTEVILNTKMVKRYYLDLFLHWPIYISIASIVFGSVAASIYIVESTVMGGIAIEIISFFIAVITYLISQNNKKIALAELELSEKEFLIEFLEDRMEITYHGSLKVIEYKNLKVTKLTKFYQFKEIKGSSLIYIIPIDYFKAKEWDEISKPINKALEEERKRKKEEKSDGHNN